MDLTRDAWWRGGDRPRQIVHRGALEAHSTWVWLRRKVVKVHGNNGGGPSEASQAPPTAGCAGAKASGATADSLNCQR